MQEAIEGFKRAAATHGWTGAFLPSLFSSSETSDLSFFAVPPELDALTRQY